MPAPKKVSGGTPKKKGKAPKKLKRRDSVQLDDVPVNTSLPPKVDGQVRCHLRVSITQILWNVANAPDFTQVRLLWWGEEGNGAVFRPVDVKKGEKKGPMHNTVARFPVRSGPKQLASYFTDMGSITLDILGGRHGTVVGRAQVDGLTALTPNKPINGFFPVFSADDEKVGELQVTIILESLMASYDSMSSVPTPDMSLQVRESFSEAQPVNPPRIVPTPAPQPVYSATDDPFRSPTANKKRSNHPTPQGVDSLIYSQRVAEIRDSGFSYPSTGPSFPQSSDDVRRSGSSAVHSKETLETSTAAGVGSSREGYHSNMRSGSAPGGLTGVVRGQPYATLADITNKGGKDLMSTFSSGGRDLVSELLERGEKLREAMIVSTLQPTPGAGKPAITDLAAKNDRVVPSGGFLKDLVGDTLPAGEACPPQLPPGLHDKRERYAIGGGFGSVGVGMRAGYDTLSLSGGSDMEANIIDLVLGPDADIEQNKLMRNAMGSPTSSISDGDLNSDLGDPIHDDEILSELFYKNPDTEESDLSLSEGEAEKSLKDRGRSDSMSSLHEPGNKRPPSRGSRRSSCSSIHLDLEPTRDVEPDSPKATPKKKKKKSRRKGGHHGGSSDLSESELLSTSRTSETSRVSFDPVPSDSDDTRLDTSRSSRKRGVDGLSVERLTLLGRVHVARVVIDNLALSLSLQTTPTKSKGRSKLGKPPRPVKKANTYFVEYQFPVVATSRDKYSPSAMATEVMRVASKKVSDGLVSFGHRSVFPVLFDGEAIDKWWKSALVFKVYSRAPAQKVPTLLGLCSVPLKTVLKSEALFLEQELEVKDRSNSASSKKSRTSGYPLVGLLKLTLELASDSKDFAKALARTRLAEMTNAKIVALPQAPPAKPAPTRPDPLSNQGDCRATFGTQTEPRPTNLDHVPLAPPSSPVKAHSTGTKTQVAGTHRTFGPQTGTTPLDACINSMEPAESLTLHTYLSIPEGENISIQGVKLPQHGDKTPSQVPKPLTGWTGRDTRTRNLYLVCRMFWLDDAARSSVCWGTVDPQFNFTQVTPVLLTGSLLERLRNNFVIVEVWDKKTTADSDQIVGIVKLPLHQFYMSYRDRRIAASLLKSQYPVISVDTSMPVLNPFTGATHGQIKVLLSMGSAEQVSCLQRLKKDGGTAVMSPERPLHYMERKDLGQDHYQNPGHHTSSENIIEHVFEVSVEGVRGLKLLETMIWGEADCFIQYHFPSQTQTQAQDGPAVVHAGLSLKTFRTATTLCVPDPVFNDVLKHKITMPEGTPVQREILTACAGAGGGPGGVPMEVWCRYYYPNTRDQLIAKGTLPLAKLCAMVTMKRQGEANVQTFSLPLTHVGAEEGGTADSGLIDLTINYRTHLTKTTPVDQYTPVSHALPGAQVCLSVSVLRASALKSAATAAARHDPAMQYAAEVGVNSYIRVKMSFLQKQDERVTRTVARSFAPEFSYHMDFPVPLLWTEVDCDALSLAEILDSAEVTMEVWHQTPGGHQDSHLELDAGEDIKGRRLVSRGPDVMLGTVTVPLLDLLKKCTGIHGWYPVHMPSVNWDTTTDPHTQEETPGFHGNRGLERVVGGLEIGVKFAHQEDRERVLHAGRGVGWVPDFEVEARDWEEADDQADGYYEVVVSADLVTCPLASALLAGQSSLDKNAHIYIRYKFYDRNAVCSKMCAAQDNDEGYVISELHHSKTLVLPASAPYNWYLSEERLELQVWLTFQPHSRESGSNRPRNRDKLIGSAYVPLDSLADHRRRQHRISGVYPLFKPGSAHLGGACIRAHITMRPHIAGYKSDSEDEDDICHHTKSPKVRSPAKVTSPVAPSVDIANTFSVHVTVERAYHLTHVRDKNMGQKVAPSCYVSYQSGERDEPLYTPVIERDDSPVWSYGRETRLHKAILAQDNKNLVFKAWHKPEGSRPDPDKTMDQVLGFVSVDLAPLTSGFSQIAGWYNIIDFNGLCQGQIKIAVIPQEPVTVELGVDGQRQTSVIGGPGFGMPHVASHLTVNNPHLDSESQGVLARFSQHYENVKHFHQSLAARLHGPGQHHPPIEEAPQATRSTLFRSLRSNIAELDNITSKLKQRLVPTSHLTADQPTRASSDPFNHTGHSTQTETETSALTNSQQFLPLPNDIPTTSNDEMRLTGDSVTMTTRYGNTPLTSTLTMEHGQSGHDSSGLIHSTVRGLRMERTGETSGDGALTERSKTEDDVTPFDTYRSQAEPPWQHGLTDEDIGAGGGVGFHDNTEDDQGHDSDDGGVMVVPRALNDVSNVNFNNMAGLPVQDYTTRLDEEDSWFASLSPRRNGVQEYDETIGPADYMPPMEPEVSTTDQEHAHLGGTASTLGGTVTSLGSVEQADPYGRTLLGGRFNKTGKIDLNYEDSWATHNLSDTQADVNDVIYESENEVREEQEEEREERILEEPYGGSHRPASRQDHAEEEKEEEVDSEVERSGLLEEDPLSYSSVSRTTLSDSHRSRSSRKAAMFRREYERHRHGGNDSSSDEDQRSRSRGGGSTESEGERPNSRSQRRRPRRPRSRTSLPSPETKPHYSDSEPASQDQENEKNMMERVGGLSLNGHNDNTLDVTEGTQQTDYRYSQTDQTQEESQLSDHRSEDRVSGGQGSKESDMSHDDSRGGGGGAGGDQEGRGLHDYSWHNISKDSQTSKSSTRSVPNFFLPPNSMEQNMRALRTATMCGSEHQVDARKDISNITARFMGSSSAKTRPLPDLQHTQRIAKIFSSKFTQ